MPENPLVKLFIGGFPKTMNELELVRMIGPYADVKTIKIVKDRISRKCKGYAFIEVKDQTHADRAMEELNGMMVEGKALTVRPATAPKEPFRAKPGQFQPGKASPAYVKAAQDAQKKKRPRVNMR
jgi:RNA recognition motif-containing protein